MATFLTMQALVVIQAELNANWCFGAGQWELVPQHTVIIIFLFESLLFVFLTRMLNYKCPNKRLQYRSRCRFQECTVALNVFIWMYFKAPWEKST